MKTRILHEESVPDLGSTSDEGWRNSRDGKFKA